MAGAPNHALTRISPTECIAGRVLFNSLTRGLLCISSIHFRLVKRFGEKSRKVYAISWFGILYFCWYCCSSMNIVSLNFGIEHYKVNDNKLKQLWSAKQIKTIIIDISLYMSEMIDYSCARKMRHLLLPGSEDVSSFLNQQKLKVYCLIFKYSNGSATANEKKCRSLIHSIIDFD